MKTATQKPLWKTDARSDYDFACTCRDGEDHKYVFQVGVITMPLPFGDKLEDVEWEVSSVCIWNVYYFPFKEKPGIDLLNDKNSDPEDDFGEELVKHFETDSFKAEISQQLYDKMYQEQFEITD